MKYVEQEKILNHHKEILGNDLGKLYYSLKNTLFSLQIKFQMYMSLYGSKETVDILNEFQGAFFGEIQDILLDDIILHINKLFSYSGKRDNKVLSFFCLPDLISDIVIKEKIIEILKKYNQNYLTTKTRRNKYIAHFDYQFFVNKKEIDISIKMDDIKEIIDSMWSIIECIEDHYFNTCIERYIYSPSMSIEVLLKKMKCFNYVGMKKIFEIANN
ncbi:MAG: hypothetical protein PQJ46_17235 [Spirochaetales bacterium]|nr:hypothetical protein [Spirochaetales bacterium]